MKKKMYINLLTQPAQSYASLERERDEALVKLEALREALGVVRGCYAALAGVDPGILAYVDAAIAKVPACIVEEDAAWIENAGRARAAEIRGGR